MSDHSRRPALRCVRPVMAAQSFTDCAAECLCPVGPNGGVDHVDDCLVGALAALEASQ